MRNYMIIDSAEVSLVDFEQVLEDSEDTLRISTDGQRTFVKWDSECDCCNRPFETPSFFSNMNNTMGPYTHEQIKEIMSYDEWNEPVIEVDIYAEEE